MIGATGGSGTRVLAAIVQRGGMFVGSDLNRSLDALDFAAFFDRWVGRELPPGAAAELRALVARQHEEAGGRPWGWKEPRSVYLLPFLAAELPGLRFLHVVRDGRDMALSENQVQLRKHGDAVLGLATSPRRCARSRSGARSTCGRPTSASASSATATCASASRTSAPSRASRVAGCCASSGSTATPSGSRRTRCSRRRRSAAGATPTRELARALTERAADALERFGYQSSSE